jgi:hypothetical protein
MNLEKRIEKLLLEAENYKKIDKMDDKLQKFDEITKEINNVRNIIDKFKIDLNNEDHSLDSDIDTTKDNFIETSTKLISSINKKIEEDLSLDDLMEYYKTIQNISKKYEIYAESTKFKMSII